MSIKPMNLSFYIVFLMSIVLFCFIAYLSSDTRIEEEFVQVQVLENETIWDLAVDYSEKHKLTPSEFVTWVEKHNQLDTDFISAGSIITIPVQIDHTQESIILVADGGTNR
ncbi:hypothetical protein JOC85_000032 [Bacillus mesophilus]|uniref:Cell division suppressor protein YneA n=1 Tax=Bacillus mesophilus TaxID=1808955 RepID=A0A6M0Q309_9BACI|nr:hypothetical protein [Bacillus mesophilus]MBM7659265.1 hypothetical protein [Bacillus mesophilus]NEY70139.1 hypothetical protein [Bacillus mesophilus]